ncbi:hypothetical protein HanPSC8_Chr06g0253721 [Helianthus annuus]|nr:hypothetical protein HanPSC8_Chr06g0253721 [Helianthus annuus]
MRFMIKSVADVPLIPPTIVILPNNISAFLYLKDGQAKTYVV